MVNRRSVTVHRHRHSGSEMKECWKFLITFRHSLNLLTFQEISPILWNSLAFFEIHIRSWRFPAIPTSQLCWHIWNTWLGSRPNFKFIHEFWSNSVFTFPTQLVQFDMSTMPVGTNTMRQSLGKAFKTFVCCHTPFDTKNLCYKGCWSGRAKTDLCLQLWETQGKVFRFPK